MGRNNLETRVRRYQNILSEISIDEIISSSIQEEIEVWLKKSRDDYDLYKDLNRKIETMILNYNSSFITEFDPKKTRTTLWAISKIPQDFIIGIGKASYIHLLFFQMSGKDCCHVVYNDEKYDFIETKVSKFSIDRCVARDILCIYDEIPGAMRVREMDLVLKKRYLPKTVNHMFLKPDSRLEMRNSFFSIIDDISDNVYGMHDLETIFYPSLD